MKPTSKLHKHVYGESLWVRLSDAEAIEKELERIARVFGGYLDGTVDRENAIAALMDYEESQTKS